MIRKPSQRFDQNWWTARLIPVLLLILALALIATLVLIGLSTAGAI